MTIIISSKKKFKNYYYENVKQNNFRKHSQLGGTQLEHIMTIQFRKMS